MIWYFAAHPWVFAAGWTTLIILASVLCYSWGYQRGCAAGYDEGWERSGSVLDPLPPELEMLGQPYERAATGSAEQLAPSGGPGDAQLPAAGLSDVGAAMVPGENPGPLLGVAHETAAPAPNDLTAVMDAIAEPRYPTPFPHGLEPTRKAGPATLVHAWYTLADAEMLAGLPPDWTR